MDQQYLNTASTGTWLSLCGDIMLQMLSQITITRVIILVLLLGNVKNIPLIWHVCTHIFDLVSHDFNVMVDDRQILT